MDFGFVWILFLAFLGIPAVICFLLVSKINALGDSLDTIHEEISALQQMMRENRKKKSETGWAGIGCKDGKAGTDGRESIGRTAAGV